MTKPIAITVDPRAGLCPGVRRAIEMAETCLEQERGLVVLGALIHNQRELDRLSQKGLTIIAQDQMDQALGNEPGIGLKAVLIRSHGISRVTRQQLAASGANLIDATCPTVRQIQNLALSASERGDQVIIVGHKDHPEVKGILSYCEPKGRVVTTLADLAQIDLSQPTTVVAQSTIGANLFDEITEVLKGAMRLLTVQDTTCRFLRRRLQQVQDFSRHQEVVFVIGGNESANTGLLFAAARHVNQRSFFIESIRDIKKSSYQGLGGIGITGGTSTPLWQLAEVKEFLEFETRKG